jgi:AraC family transcriptional regulator
LTAIGVRVAESYGGMKPGLLVMTGGLSRWQLSRAQDLLTANLSEDVSVRDVAAECGLSPGHFTRAFKQSLGVPPYQWVMRQRIDMAKLQLSGKQLPIAEIAVNCGFADQSHLTRIFARATGVTPSHWRRSS